MDEVKCKYVDVCCIELMIGEVLLFEDEDFIEEEDVFIIFLNKGYIKCFV